MWYFYYYADLQQDVDSGNVTSGNLGFYGDAVEYLYSYNDTNQNMLGAAANIGAVEYSRMYHPPLDWLYPQWYNGSIESLNTAFWLNENAVGGVTHDITGAIVGDVGNVTASLAHNVPHALTAAVVGSDSLLSSAFVHNVPHALTSAIVGDLGGVSASLARSTGAVTHALTSAIVGDVGNVTASIARTRQHDITSAIVGDTGSVSASIARTRQHDITSAIVGDVGNVTASIARTRQHALSGTVVGDVGSVAASIARAGAAVTHALTAAIVGDVGGLSSLFARVSPGTKVGGDDAPRGIYYQDQPARKKRKKLYEKLDKSIEDKYLELTGNPVAKEKAEEIAQPYVQAESVDWDSFNADIAAVELMLNLYQAMLDAQDEDDIETILLLM